MVSPKRNLIFVFALAAFLLPISQANSMVKVFACEPEWAALAREIGGDRVTAFAATNARQDPHHIRARPSLVAKIRRANLVVCSGSGLEIGCLPLLLQRGGGSIQPGQVGNLMASHYVDVIEKPISLDRSLGDLHPEGNPHVHLDPNNIMTLARILQERLGLIDPAGKDHYASRLKAFSVSWSTAQKGWKQRVATFNAVPVIVHHKFWSYFIHWIGLREVGTLESKPGIPPSVKHLESLIASIQENNVKAILRTPYDDVKPSDWLANRTNIPVIEMPATVNSEARPGALVDFFDELLNKLEASIGRR